MSNLNLRNFPDGLANRVRDAASSLGLTISQTVAELVERGFIAGGIHGIAATHTANIAVYANAVLGPRPSTPVTVRAADMARSLRERMGIDPDAPPPPPPMPPAEIDAGLRVVEAVLRGDPVRDPSDGGTDIGGDPDPSVATMTLAPPPGPHFPASCNVWFCQRCKAIGIKDNSRGI